MQTLIEVAQNFDDGRRRLRHMPLSEKLKPNEEPCVGAERGIREELGKFIGPDTTISLQLDPCFPDCSYSQSVSKSYPGLLSIVRSQPDFLLCWSFRVSLHDCSTHDCSILLHG
jgi:hypothetical protein